MRRTFRGLPAARHGVAFEPGLEVPAADGSVLLSDHYFPDGGGGFPTLLVRSPYGRGFPWASLYGLLYAEQGFHVVLQSCRGTGGSGGDFTQWHNEAIDGAATVAWLRRQPWFNGVLGTVGPSYLGYVQWALAVRPPPELRAMVIQVGAHSPYDFYYSGGVFKLEDALVAGVSMTHQGRGARPYLRAIVRLALRARKAVDGLPLIDSYPRGLGERAPWLEEVMTQPERDAPHWRGTDLGAVADHVTVPTSLVAGWNDVLLEQTFQQYERLRRAGCETSLLAGPWTHTSALGEGLADMFPDSLAWLRAHLCDDPSGLRPTPVRVHIGGEWRDLDGWPPAGSRSRLWHLNGDGGLAPRPDESRSSMTFRYDPADPTPSVGGPVLSAKAGIRDNRRLEARDDVLVFTSAPLAEPVEILGRARAELDVTTSTGHGDVFVRLCDVDPRGRSHNVCDAVLRLKGSGTLALTMSPTAHRFRAGHRIRLQVSGGAHPRFARNCGTGEPFATATRLVPSDITIALPAALILPAP
jgi:putative CocE/NonD family hydrolase